MAAYVKQGQPVHVAGAPNEGMVRITEGEERNFIGIGTIAEDGRVAPKRLVVEYAE
ncbi:tRNA pseudouridine synthase B [Yersinia enterocolitica]|nr:tRNA pseudouridine synthase B [Yersinia enterocolitica]